MEKYTMISDSNKISPHQYMKNNTSNLCYNYGSSLKNNNTYYGYDTNNKYVQKDRKNKCCVIL